MCCENSPDEVEGTLENEEHMMEPDAEDESASLLTCHIKKKKKGCCPGQSCVCTQQFTKKKEEEKLDTDEAVVSKARQAGRQAGRDNEITVFFQMGSQ